MASLDTIAVIDTTDDLTIHRESDGITIYQLRRHFAYFCKNQLGVVAHPGDIFCSIYYTFLDTHTKNALGIQSGQNASSFTMTNLAQVKVYIGFIRSEVAKGSVAADGDTLQNYLWGKVFRLKSEALTAIDLFADFCERELSGWLSSEES